MAAGWLEIVTDPTVPLGIDTRIFLVRGEAARTKDTTFAEWGRALRFPQRFEYNWDSFTDNLLALPGPLAVVVDRADQLLIDEPPAPLGVTPCPGVAEVLVG
jgi:hypothetical protein